jgi:hypothetical protein
MFSGILLTVGSIGVMMGAGTAIGAMFSMFHNYEYTPSRKSPKPGGSPRAPHRDRIDRLNDRVSPFDM